MRRSLTTACTRPPLACLSSTLRPALWVVCYRRAAGDAGRWAFPIVNMINGLLVALASELSFVVGIFVGSIMSSFAALAITAVRGYGRLSTARAFLQGTIIGFVAGISGLGVAVMLGRSLSVPSSWLLWLALVPPILGEFGHFLNRFSLRYRGKPNTGVFVPLGRLHAAAWVPLRRNIYTLGLEVFRDSEPQDIPYLAVQKADWFIGRAFWGLAIGAAFSVWLLASNLSMPRFL